jgi:cytochrome P450
MASASAFVHRPDHVPESLVFDFDYFHDPRLAADVHEGMMSLIGEAPDVFWTPRNGGHWVVTRWNDVNFVMTNPAIFSSHVMTPTATPGLKIPLPPQDLDAPDHMRHRLLLLQFLAPREVRRYEPITRALIGEIIDQIIGKGGCEFMADVGVPMPVKVFMTMMGMDLSRYAEFVVWVNDILGASDPNSRMGSYLAMNRYLGELIQQRLANPGDDPVSILLRSEIDGKRISVERVHEMCNLLFLAGLDTVTNAMAFIVRFLAQNSEVRHRLRDEPQKIPSAVEELMRRHAFVNIPRRVAENTEAIGPKMQAGDVVLCSLTAASNDPRNVSHPEIVDLDRPHSPHVAFNTGPHNCAGATLARIELKVFLEEWLSRIPDFAIAPGFVPKTRGGPVMALHELPLVWG